MKKLTVNQDTMPSGAIVRRVDDLGRIVINKELRRSLKIRENDPIAMWEDDGKLVMAKYSKVTTIKEAAEHWALAIAKLKGCSVLVSDRDEIVIAKTIYGFTLGYAGMPVSDELRKVMEDDESDTSHCGYTEARQRSFFHTKSGGRMPIDIMGSVIVPIKCASEVVGTVTLYRGKDAVTSLDASSAETLAAVIGSELEL